MGSREVRSAYLLTLSLLGLLAYSGQHAARAADVLTQRNNNSRTGAVLDESILTTQNVSSNRFRKLWTLYADGQITAQPLYVSNLAVDTTGQPGPAVKGTFNAVIIATLHNTVYVYDADKENPGPEGQTTPLWAKWLGPPRPGGKDIDMWSTNDPEWGILSTPVVSDDKSTLYVVAWHNEDAGGFQYRLHALNLKNGAERQAPANIGPSSTDPSNPCRSQNVFNPCTQKQRTALLLSGGVIYIAFGGDGNRGAIFGFDAETLAQRTFWSSTPTGQNGGIWQSGQGLAADGDGNLYLVTGNGTFDADRGGQNYGNSFLRLRLEGNNLVVKDYFTPCNFKFLNDFDLDLGSAGPVLLPGPPELIVSGGKEGVLYLVNRGNMGKFAASPTAPDCRNPNIVQEFLAFEPHQQNGETHYGNVHGSPVYWNGPDAARVYAWGENNHLKAFILRNGKLQDVEHPKMSAYRPPPGMPGGMAVVSANGRKAGSGVVWAVVPLDGDANKERGVKGIVLALDAQDVSRTLWTSEQDSQRDRLGLFAKFAPPLVAGGRVFVVTYGDDEPRRVYPPGVSPTAFPPNYYVAVYGLGASHDPARPIVNQDGDDVSLVRATTSPLNLDTASCQPVDGASIDCTEALTGSANAPAFHTVLLPANGNTEGCALVRVTTASKDSGLANGAGIGFYSTQVVGGNQAAGNSGRFIPKDQLKSTGAGALIGGAPATLHEFAGVANCRTGSETLDRLFKPYMQFEDAADGKIYRNWDRGSNYRIGSDSPAIDRSGDVLQQ